MLYLEDYLEMIEHLPQELRDRFTEMREMDLQVQNAMDSLDERVKQFFANARKQKPEPKEFEKLQQDYYKALEDADEKVQIANQIYDLVDRYLRRLDQELQKFKMELEADNAGITEILERRSLELDNPPPSINSVKGESKRKKDKNSNSSLVGLLMKRNEFVERKMPNQGLVGSEKRVPTEKVLNTIIAAEVVRESPAAVVRSGGSLDRNTVTPVQSNIASAPEKTALIGQSSFGYNLAVGSNAIAAAASQAIAATQQMQQGRRTASLKASYEAINSGLQGISREFTVGHREIGSLTSMQAGASNAAATEPVVATTPVTKTNRTKKQSSRAAQQQIIPPPTLDDSEDSSVVDDNVSEILFEDPNEPRYCICNQVSYGDMVACDNEDCPFEWFHYACVGITQPPKGKWFCPQCTSAMKRRGRKDK